MSGNGLGEPTLRRLKRVDLVGLERIIAGEGTHEIKAKSLASLARRHFTDVPNGNFIPTKAISNFLQDDPYFRKYLKPPRHKKGTCPVAKPPESKPQTAVARLEQEIGLLRHRLDDMQQEIDALKRAGTEPPRSESLLDLFPGPRFH